MSDCIFCQIIAGKIPSKLVYQSSTIVAFADINPSADVHILIVPKKHIKGMQDLTKDDEDLLSDVYLVVNKLVRQYNLSDNLYRVVINGGKAQHVPHLHFHLLGGNWKKMV